MQSATPGTADDTAIVSSATLRAALNEPTAVLAFADAKGVLTFACCGRTCQTAASSPALWTKLAANRWPCTASGPLAGAVRGRGPRDFFRAHVAAERSILPTFAPSTAPRSRFDEDDFFDDLLFTLELRHGDRVLCSVSRPPSEVLRRGFGADYFAAEPQMDPVFRHFRLFNYYPEPSEVDGLVFDRLDARLDYDDGWGDAEGEFPPGSTCYLTQEKLSVTVCVVRRSDGRVSRLVPPFKIGEGTKSQPFGYGYMGGGGFGPWRFFAANEGLTGSLPIWHRDVPHQLGIWTWGPRWRGGQYTTPAGRQEELIAHRKIVCHMQIGTTSEFPSDMRYNTWSPQEDPSVVVGADGSVLIRRIVFYFTCEPNITPAALHYHLGERGDPDPTADVELDDLHSTLRRNLNFV